MPAVSRYRLVIFDLDGTLIDSAAWLLGAVNQVLRPYVPRPWTVTDLVATAGAPEREVLARLVPPAALEGVMAQYAAALRRTGSLAAQPGISKLLSGLDGAHVGQALFSGAGRNLGELRLALAGWNNRFDVRVWGDEAAPKPAPEGIWRTLERAGGVPAAHAVYVGDTSKDAAAAAAAGVDFIGVSWGDEPGGPKCASLAASPDDLAALLFR